MLRNLGIEQCERCAISVEIRVVVIAVESGDGRQRGTPAAKVDREGIVERA